MTGVEIAALIAACALLALVVFVIVKVSPILSRLNKTVDNVNHSLEVITKDVDSLSIEVEGLLNKANVLVDDVKMCIRDSLETDQIGNFTRSVVIGAIGEAQPGLEFSPLTLQDYFISITRKENE